MSEQNAQVDWTINPPCDAADPKGSFYGEVARDAFKRADHHEFDAAAYAVIMAFKTFGDSDDYPAWEKALMESLETQPEALTEGANR